MSRPVLVSQSVADGIALIAIDNPPVNALSTSVRSQLLEALRCAGERADIRAVILTGRGTAFCAGADINEMESPLAEPFLPELTEAIDAMPMPVIAAINGSCLGGGAEIALACDARIAGEQALIGLPETNLGIVPGAGGTQRLMRLVGIEQAISMICEARLLRANDAISIGLVDAVVADPVTHARQALGKAGKQRFSDRPVPEADEAAVGRIAARIARSFRRSVAVLAALDLLLATRNAPFAEGLRRERDLFLRLRESPEARALRYLFKAERSASRSHSAAPARTIRKIGVAGGGTMGAGIALSCIQAGFKVVVLERDAQASVAARSRLFSLIDGLVARGKLSSQQADASRERVGFESDLSSVADCSLVIEAVFENYEVKQQLFSNLSSHLRPGTIIASNTSYLDIDKLAAMLPEPENVAGMHFFAPANLMKLVEIVPGIATQASATATLHGLARRIGKTAVTTGNAEGFIGNRIFSAYRREMECLVVDGASPDAIDDALEAFGFAMGPFAVFDMSGLDIAWEMRKRNAAGRNQGERYVGIADRLCEAGLFGRKSGRGWYDYSTPAKKLSTAAAAFIDEERRHSGRVARSVSPQEIVDVALRTMAKEGMALLDEGIAKRSSDVDIVLVTGYGFPRDKGGPMFIANNREEIRTART